MFWKNALLPLSSIFPLYGADRQRSRLRLPNFFWRKVLNPYSLLTNRVLLGKTEFVNLGGFPVLTWQTAIWFALIAGLVLL